MKRKYILLRTVFIWGLIALVVPVPGSTQYEIREHVEDGTTGIFYSHGTLTKPLESLVGCSKFPGQKERIEKMIAEDREIIVRPAITYFIGGSIGASFCGVGSLSFRSGFVPNFYLWGLEFAILITFVTIVRQRKRLPAAGADNKL